MRRKLSRYFLFGVGVFITAATLLPFIRTDQWWIRIFDFPRLQLAIVGATTILSMMLCRPLKKTGRLILVLLFAALAIQVWHIVPYTPIAAKQVKESEGKASIRILVANVLQDNRNSAKLIEQIDLWTPDVILLNETDEWWTREMRQLETTHPFTIIHPRENTYGMNLYSRFELLDAEVRFLNDPAVPSIRTRLLVGSANILFYGVHPRPPAIKREQKNERQDSAQRDAELVIIAREVQNFPEPVIVAGDFNDVAWSHTTRLFQRTSRLLDPRVGRGLYNSYNAKIPIFRYPLDHLFHSEHFTLGTMERLGYFGSDHFPIFAALRLEPDAVRKQEAPPPKPGDRKEAKEILQKEPD